MSRTADFTRMTTKPVPPGTVLFLIGMRVRKPWQLISWLRTAFEMPRMLAYLEKNPDAGLLAWDAYLGRSALVVCYWKDAESLRNFAANPQAPHAGPWRWFNKRVLGSRAVGIWHETYVIGEHEAIYGDMPRFGLARAIGSAPIDGHNRTAKQRITASA